MRGKYEDELEAWIKHEKQAIELMNIANNHWIENSVKLKIFRKPIIGKTSSQIIDAHNNRLAWPGAAPSGASWDARDIGSPSQGT